MDVIELKSTISRKLEIPIAEIGREEFKGYAVRFHYLGSSYRATTELNVEKVDGSFLVTDDDARRIEKLLRNEEWDGQGLPPVGAVCEGRFPRHPGIKFEWQECLVLYVFERECAVKAQGTSTLHYCDDFRPIRSEADKKRKDGVLALAFADPNVAKFEYGERNINGELVGSAWYELYDKIAAGEVAGIRID